MADKQWQKVKEVFNAAQRLTPEVRWNYINQICGENKTLLAEVASLLASHDSSESFMETPAVGEVAETFADSKTLSEGIRFGHYEIIRQIGIGGMGEVYLANDKKLDRKVAVKILNKNFSKHESNLKRFLQEAKAASALNHPNILVIHEIGESEGTHYLVSEFIEGKTLREVLKEKNLKLSKILDISIQIANALSTAHEAHLAHRDIKPENVMIRPDGLVKVLDFGLAKLVEQKNQSILSFRETTLKQNQTAEGIILGTINYMSPEQAKGKQIDERTDIFSFGVVLYEMLAGKVPFAGDSMSETFANLLNAEPQPLLNLPEQLQRIVIKMLCKNKHERYQTMKELLADLIDLSEKMKAGKLQDFQSKTGTPEENTAIGKTQKQKVSTVQNSAFISRNRWKIITFSLSTFLLILILSLGYYNFSKVGNAGAPFRGIKLTRLTNSGNVNHVALSSDGNLMAYDTSEKEGVSIWVRQIETDNPINLLPPKKGYLTFLTFSTDGKMLYYGFFSGDKSDPALYVVPSLGGASHKIPETDANFISFAPDGKRFAQIAANGDASAEALMINSLEGGEAKIIARRKSPRRFNVDGKTCAWSPDGNTIAVVSNDKDSEGDFSGLIGINPADGSEKVLSAKRWNYLDSLQWLKDGSGLLAVGSDALHSPNQIWFVSVADGTARMLSNDFNNYSQIEVTANGKQIVAVQESQTSSIWQGRIGQNSDDFKEIYSETGSLDELVLTAGGNFVFRSDAAGKSNLWTMKTDGLQKKQITVDIQVDERGLCATPDGKQVVFPARKNGKVNLWQVDAEGGEIAQITNGEGEFYPVCLADNHSLIYQKGFGYGVKSTLWKILLKGGEAVQLTDYFAMRPTLSPDGRQVAFFYMTDDNWRIGIASAENGSLEKSVAVPDGVIDRVVRWSPDGKSLFYIANKGKIGNIWSLPLNGQAPKQITNFNSQFLMDFVLLKDSKEMIVSRSIRFNDVVSISEQ